MTSSIRTRCDAFKVSHRAAWWAYDALLQSVESSRSQAVLAALENVMTGDAFRAASCGMQCILSVVTFLVPFLLLRWCVVKLVEARGTLPFCMLSKTLRLSSPRLQRQE